MVQFRFCLFKWRRSTAHLSTGCPMWQNWSKIHMKCWVGGWQFSFFLTAILLDNQGKHKHATNNIANVRYVEIWLSYCLCLCIFVAENHGCSDISDIVYVTRWTIHLTDYLKSGNGIVTVTKCLRTCVMC